MIYRRIIAAMGAALAAAAFGDNVPRDQIAPIATSGSVSIPLPNALPSSPDDGPINLQQWEVRRDEMRQTIEHYFSGRMPPPSSVEAIPLRSEHLPEADFRLVKLSLGPAKSLNLTVAVFTPPGSHPPVPVILFLSPFGTPGAPAPDPVPPKYLAVSPSEFAHAHAEAFRRGFAMVTYYFQQGAPDHPGQLDSPVMMAYPDYDWGHLAAWSWTLSRCVDFIRLQPWADATKIAAVGHSRLGKTVLLAGAFDEHIAVVVAAGSGCGGTGAFRISGKAREGKEGLEEITQRFPYWFSPRLRAFAGKVDQLPFDANWLMSMVAPRALLDCEAYEDPYCNGKAAFAAYSATTAVYSRLGVPSHLGLHFRGGGHALTDEDWTAILDFAGAQFAGEDPGPSFHAPPEIARLK